MNTAKKRETKCNILQELLLIALPLVLVAGVLTSLTGCEGPAGSAGEDGSVIRTGQGTPSADIGKNGDFYLDQNSSELYGPKSEDGWGTPIMLQGEDGSRIFTGTGQPESSLGEEGDFYLDKENYELYGPKTNDGWDTPISLKGTANVLYSSWIDIDWNIQDSDAYKRMSISESRITDKLLDTGVIKMYMKFEGGDVEGTRRSAVALPMVTQNSSLYFFATTTTGAPPAGLPSGFTGLIVFNESVNGDPVNPFEDTQIRYVLIPGGEPLKANHGSVDLNNYEEVKRYFGIPD